MSMISMVMAANFAKSAALTNIPVIACGFCGLIITLTHGIIFVGYREAKR